MTSARCSLPEAHGAGAGVGVERRLEAHSSWAWEMGYVHMGPCAMPIPSAPQDEPLEVAPPALGGPQSLLGVCPQQSECGGHTPPAGEAWTASSFNSGLVSVSQEGETPSEMLGI